jgi:hypothetical protein
MIAQEIKQNIFPLIKVTSTLLISGAIGLEGWRLLMLPISEETLNVLTPIFWIGRLGMAAHLIEALIAALYAPSRGKNPLRYSLHTFFVGTVGLVELFEQTSRVPHGVSLSTNDIDKKDTTRSS